MQMGCVSWFEHKNKIREDLQFPRSCLHRGILLEFSHSCYQGLRFTLTPSEVWSP